MLVAISQCGFTVVIMLFMSDSQNSVYSNMSVTH